MHKHPRPYKFEILKIKRCYPDKARADLLQEVYIIVNDQNKTQRRIAKYICVFTLSVCLQHYTNTRTIRLRCRYRTRTRFPVRRAILFRRRERFASRPRG